jgi:DNA-directed RNA polymerase subunit H (RpoH/RPB5)
MEQLFEKYKNIQLFATSPKYRNYELVGDGFVDAETFKNKIQIFGHIMHSFRDPKNPDIPIDLYLFESESQTIKNTALFKGLLDKYKDTQIIILITKEELNVYRKKSILKKSKIECKNYLHKHFMMELKDGPLCSKHTILPSAEVTALCYDIFAHGHNFPSILENDPQNIWIGGKVNDIVMIESHTPITGWSIHYRIVAPASGKAIQDKAGVEQQWTSQKKETINPALEPAQQNTKPVNDDDYYDDIIMSDYEDLL